MSLSPGPVRPHPPWAGLRNAARRAGVNSLIMRIALLFLLAILAFASPAPHASPATCNHSETEQEFKQIAESINASVGAAALLIEKRETLSLHPDNHYPMQSVYKFPIAMAVLAQVDAGKFTLDQMVHVSKTDLLPAPYHSPLRDAHPTGGDFPLRELLRLAVQESDGSASDVVLRLLSIREANNFLHMLGVRDLIIATTEQEMATGPLFTQYRNWASPTGAVQLLERFQHGDGLSPESHALLLKWMTETQTFPHRIKGLLPPGTVVAHKTGTSGEDAGTVRATNDIGIVTLPDGRHMAIAVFVSDAHASDDARDAVIAKITRAAWDCFTAN